MWMLVGQGTDLKGGDMQSTINHAIMLYNNLNAVYFN